jgi:mRNA interferase HigB
MGTGPLLTQSQPLPRCGPLILLLCLTASQFVKYSFVMFIVTRRHLLEAMERYPDAAKEIAAWMAITAAARWKTFVEVRATFKDADTADGYVIFNIRHNMYRLITVLHYSKVLEDGSETGGHAYIRSFLTHKEYDNPANWDREFGQ